MIANREGKQISAHSPFQLPFGFTLNVLHYLIALLLFVLALLPRLPGLRLFLTSDENTNIFLAGSEVIAAFLQGDLRGTYWHFYPGVTMSWLDAVGMAGQYLFASLTGVFVPPFTEYIHGDILSLIVASRLPYAGLTAAAVPVTYLLTRQLLSEPEALLGALFVAFDPFYLAHSRVAHGDAPVTVFMSLSALSFFVLVKYMTKGMGQKTKDEAPQTNHRASRITHHASRARLYELRFSYLILSAIFGGLAALTKAPGQFMALFVVGMSVVYAGLELWCSRCSPSPKVPHTWRIVRRWLTVVIIWGGVSLAVFILLWPSMWVDPIGTFRQMWFETFGKVSEGHLVYFFGRPTLDPGPWFYFYVIPFRLTPATLIGGALSFLLLVFRDKLFFTSQQRGEQHYLSAHFLLWFFTISLVLFGNLSPKKQDRYLLALFPFLNLLAAIGWLGLFDLIRHYIEFRFRSAPTSSKSPTPALRADASVSTPQSPVSNLQSPLLGLLSPVYCISILLLVLLHFIPVLTYYPYYLTYFNPLMGGPTRAVETTLMGWGEGMEQVAAYLNSKPNADKLYVASTPSQTFLPYFAGTGENFYTNDIAFRADYVVLYLAQMQRLAPSLEIVNYFETQEPEKVITIKDVTYAKIYPSSKRILADVPAGATPANIGLNDTIRLAGYELANPQITLYWHALTPVSADYTVSVRAHAADGRLLAQEDSWPVDGLLPTSQWRQGDYVADTHTLDMPEAALNQVNQFEIVVYNLDTGDALGPPITLPLSRE